MYEFIIIIILWRIYLMIFFYIFFISSLFIIFIMTLHLLQSDDESSLKYYFFIVFSSFIMFTYNMIFNDKHIFSCICNCLLNNYINIFNFCMFFTMNIFWFTWCFSFKLSWKHQFNFNAIFFHERSLLIFFFNVNIFINSSIMSNIFFSLLHKCCNLTLLLFCDMSTLFSIVFKLALLSNSCNSLSFDHFSNSLCFACNALFKNLLCIHVIVFLFISDVLIKLQSCTFTNFINAFLLMRFAIFAFHQLWCIKVFCNNNLLINIQFNLY